MSVSKTSNTAALVCLMCVCVHMCVCECLCVDRLCVACAYVSACMMYCAFDTFVYTHH